MPSLSVFLLSLLRYTSLFHNDDDDAAVFVVVVVLRNFGECHGLSLDICSCCSHDDDEAKNVLLLLQKSSYIVLHMPSSKVFLSKA